MPEHTRDDLGRRATRRHGGWQRACLPASHARVLLLPLLPLLPLLLLLLLLLLLRLLLLPS